MSEKFSYSKIDTYQQCGFRYKLRYVDGHFISTDSIATELGTAIHATEETIANKLKANEAIDYVALKNTLLLKLCELEHKYPIAFKEKDKSNRTTKDKVFGYLETGIYRLEKFLMANSHLEVVATEQEFNFDWNSVHFHGFIDRVLYNKHSKKFIVQDIKTYAVPVESKNLATPLQFVVYTLAMKSLYNVDDADISCSYDLPFCDVVQEAGTKGYMKRGTTKLNELLQAIFSQDFTPKPTPLCHWCEFCPTNPDIKEEAKFLCPYYSLWTRENKTHQVASTWKGLENHDAVLLEYKNQRIQLPKSYYTMIEGV